MKHVHEQLTDPNADRNLYCDICCHGEGDCICPECPVCGAVGDLKCYQKHGMKLTQEQIESQKKAAEIAEQERQREIRAIEAEIADNNLQFT